MIGELLGIAAGLSLGYAFFGNARGIEPDSWFRKNWRELGIFRSNVNPASVDVCLGGHIIEYDDKGHRQDYGLSEGQVFHFIPGKFYLIHTEEETYCPHTHAWMLTLKSSMGRRGMQMTHTGWGDPGFKGQATVGIKVHKPLSLLRGQPFAQLVYMRLTKPPRRDYQVTGRYNGSKGATTAVL